MTLARGGCQQSRQREPCQPRDHFRASPPGQSSAPLEWLLEHFDAAAAKDINVRSKPDPRAA